MSRREFRIPVRATNDDDDFTVARAKSEAPVEAIVNSRRSLREASSGGRSSGPNAKTDKLLESLHVSLRQQLLISGQPESDAKASAFSNHLSSAVIRTRGKRHEKEQDAKKRPASKGRTGKSAQPEIERSLARARELLTTSDALQIEQSGAREELRRGELALSAKEFKTASSRFNKVNRKARMALRTALPGVLCRAKDSLKSLEKHHGNAKDAKKLLVAAERAIERRQFEDAARFLNDSTRKIRDGEYEILLNIMSGAKERLMLARKAGVSVEGPLDLLRISREKLKLGKLEESIGLVEESQELVELLLKREYLGRQHLSECMKAIKVAELLGAGSKDLEKRMVETRALFKANELDKALESSRDLTAIAKEAAYGKAASTYEMAERALGVATSLGLEVPSYEETLKLARENLEKDSLVRSFTLSTSVIVDTSASILESLNIKMRSIDQFAKEVEGEVMSLTEVREAIEHTKERSLEDFRKYAKCSEELVNKAFESAASYTRVSQDVVKGVFDNSLAVNGGKIIAEGGPLGKEGVSAEIVASAGSSLEDKRLRIISLYLDGKVTESQLERLLTLIDSSVARVSLV